MKFKDFAIWGALTGGSAYWTRESWIDQARFNQEVSDKATNVFQDVHGRTPTPEELHDFTTLITTRNFEHLLLPEHKAIDQSLVDNEYADSINRAWKDNDIVNAEMAGDGAEFAVFLAGVLTAIFAINTIVATQMRR